MFFVFFCFFFVVFLFFPAKYVNNVETTTFVASTTDQYEKQVH